MAFGVETIVFSQPLLDDRSQRLSVFRLRPWQAQQPRIGP